jgi:hypothetical protein
MAVDHDSAQTLTRFRFSRAGDRWKHALPTLRRKPVAFAVLDVLNIELAWQDRCYRVATSCPNCGALKLTADDTYALRFMASGVDHLERADCDVPDRVECLACQRPVDLLDLLKDCSGRDLDRLLTEGALRRYNPQPQVFIVAQTEDAKLLVGRTIRDALRRHLGPVFPLVWKLSRIEALDSDHALALVQEHHASMTWRDVAINRDLEPEDWNWHGGPLAPWERDRVRQQEHAARIQTRKELDAEVAEFRRQRERDLGL